MSLEVGPWLAFLLYPISPLAPLFVTTTLLAVALSTVPGPRHVTSIQNANQPMGCIKIIPSVSNFLLSSVELIAMNMCLKVRFDYWKWSWAKIEKRTSEMKENHFWAYFKVLWKACPAFYFSSLETFFPARVLRALGLLLADSALTHTFSYVQKP